MRTRLLACTVLAAVGMASCGDDDPPTCHFADPSDGGGCPLLFDMTLAMPGDPIDGDSWGTFAQGFLRDYCTCCHSTVKTGTDRNGAPLGYDWDDEATVRMHLEDIRGAAAGFNFMPPPNAPQPPCEDRMRIARWVDAAAP